MRGFRSVNKKLILSVLIGALVLLLALWLWRSSPDTVWRIIRYNISGIDDYKIFPSRPLQASLTPFNFNESSDQSWVPQMFDEDNQAVPLDDLLSINDTVAFLFIKDDTIFYERYFQGYSESSPSLSFSMAKSFLSILIGCAIDDGYIQSVEQVVTDFVPELAANGFDIVTIEHLLQMTSGMAYIENDNPFGIHPRFYYTADLESEILKLGMREQPEQEFIYKSGENALLGLILSRALGTKTITDYMQERIWGPLGMEYDGAWSIDHPGDGLEKTWCCVSATARDFAKIGRLYLQMGNWNGEQIVSPSWVEQSTRIDTSEGSDWTYQYQWWLVSEDSSAYMAIGHLGQYLYIDPEEQVIIVRLGTSTGTFVWGEWIAVFDDLIDEVNSLK